MTFEGSDADLSADGTYPRMECGHYRKSSRWVLQGHFTDGGYEGEIVLQCRECEEWLKQRTNNPTASVKYLPSMGARKSEDEL